MVGDEHIRCLVVEGPAAGPEPLVGGERLEKDELSFRLDVHRGKRAAVVTYGQRQEQHHDNQQPFQACEVPVHVSSMGATDG